MNSSTISITSTGIVGGLAALGHQKDRDLVVARPHELEKRARLVVAVVGAERPVDQHGVDRGVRGDDRRAILGGGRFDDFDGSTLQLLHQRPRGAALGGGSAELVVHDERAHVSVV